MEFIKHWNPQMVVGQENGDFVIQTYAARVPEERVAFLITNSVRRNDDQAAVFKIIWYEEYNRLSLSPQELMGKLATSALAPGPGGKRFHSLPAAIYWADGIAGVSPKDLRFVGVPAEEVL